MRSKRNGLIRKIRWGFILGILVVAAASVYASEDDRSRRIQNIQGDVVAMDWVGSKMTVNSGLAYPNDEVTVEVSSNTLISREGQRLSFSDIEVEDGVSVDYVVDPGTGAFIAKRIDDMNLGNE